jgi:hypothetical protein
VVEIAGLQLHRLPGDVDDAGGDAVGPEPVDDRAVARLPQEMADALGGADEQEVVQLVEIPLVEQEPVEPLMLRSEPDWRLRRADVEVPGGDEARNHGDQRRQLHPHRHVVEIVQDVVVGQQEQRALPEGVVARADEGVLEDDAGEQRARGEDEQRHQHHRRRFMDMVHDLMAGARLAVEGHEDQPPGIEAGEGGGDDEQAEGEGGELAMRGERTLDDSVLGEEAGRADDRHRDADAGQRQRADDHHPVGDGDQLAQTAHLAHVLLVGNGMDDRAGAKEQQRLEEGVGEQVEDRRRIEAHAERDEHVAELRAGRIGNDALDVVLHQADGGGEEGGERADEGDDEKRCVRQFEDRRQPRQHEHAGRDHGGGVDQRRDRRRALHGVGQPGVQRHLRRLAHRAHEQQQADDGQRARLRQRPVKEAEHRRARLVGALGDRRRIGEDGVEIDRAEQHEHAEQAEQEAEIADAVDDEGLDGGGTCRRPLIPEADQQVGGETDAFPAEEHLHQIVGRHQHQHGEGEQRQIGEEARPVRVVVHVADGIDVDQRRDGVDHDQHHHGQRVDPQRPGDVKAAGADERRHRHGERPALAESDGEEGDPRQHGRHDEEAGCDVFRRLGTDRAAEKAGDQEAEQRKEDDRVIHCRINPSSC